ncbi:hypothetical protein LSCM1_03956 [Leishmania martiniquensis]|uniref:Amino acid permease/ SLC12A domain-containing protein n=1 Tax=Leishmania martiniquensis TaxID=1580590 RepID=A0A836KH39_9TRYP|nr:hypothetical protein LSCM1_03956 [Leishmania martiniquensis]
MRCRRGIVAVVDALRHSELHRMLDLTALVSVGIRAVLGAGVFCMTGHAAPLYVGPMMPLLFLVGMCPCFCIGLCDAELSMMMPVGGSAYTYAFLAFGGPRWLRGGCVPDVGASPF